MDMTPAYWEKAHAIARELAGDVDRNELGKVVSYFRQTQDGEKLFLLLGRLPTSNYIRSQQTKGYFTRMGQVLQQHLRDVTDPKAATLVISWAFRLMSYYQLPSGGRPVIGRGQSRSPEGPRRPPQTPPATPRPGSSGRAGGHSEELTDWQKQLQEWDKKK